MNTFVIEVETLTKRYGDVNPARGSFSVSEGEVLVCGPNGAGNEQARSKSGRGDAHADGGRVSVCGLIRSGTGAEVKHVIGAELHHRSPGQDLGVREALDLFGGLSAATRAQPNC